MASDIDKVRVRLRWITAAFFFISGIITGTWTSRIPEMQQKFGLNDAKWGGVLFSIPIGLFLALPLSSWIVARFTSYKMMAISCAIYALILCAIPFAPNVAALVITLFVFGMSRNLFNISINTNSIQVQKFYKKPIVTTFHGIWSLACLVAAGIGTLVIGLRIKPVYHFIIISIVLLIVTMFIRVKRSDKSENSAGRRPFFVKPDKYLFLLGIMCFCAMVFEGTMFDWSINYFNRVVKADGKLVTAGYTAFITSMTIGRFVGDRLIAFFGHLQMLIINGLMIATGFAIAVLFPSVWAASFGFLLIGFGDSILVPTIYTLAGRSEKMLPGYAIASVTFIGYVGFLTAPLVVGSISQAFGMQYSFALMVVFGAMISVIALSIRRKYKGLLAT